jgi:hypothetical protein
VWALTPYRLPSRAYRAPHARAPATRAGLVAFCGADGELVAAALALHRSKPTARRVTLASLHASRAPAPGLPSAAGGGAAGDAGGAAGAEDAGGDVIAAAVAAIAAGVTADNAGAGGVTLRLGGACEAEAFPLVDSESSVDAMAGALQLRQHALHRCRWSRGGGGGGSRRLAAAGAAGVLRVLRVRVAEDE